MLACGLVVTHLAAQLIAAPKPLRPVPKNKIPKSLTIGRNGWRMAIPDRKHAPGATPDGWCGETAIQQVMLFHGAFFSQKHINSIGTPKYGGMHSSEIPGALKRLGATFKDYSGRQTLTNFMQQIRQRGKAGTPSLVGMKINPTKHPAWDLDHFVIVSGASEKSMVLNTTWGRTDTMTNAQLASTNKGLSFKHRRDWYYGLAIGGFSGSDKLDAKVRIYVTKENIRQAAVIVVCEGLTKKTRHVLTKDVAFKPTAKARVATRFYATGTVHGFYDIINKSTPTVYRCRRVEQSTPTSRPADRPVIRKPPPTKPTTRPATPKRPPATKLSAARKSLRMANLYANHGLKSKAAGLYKKLITEHPESPEATEAKKRLAELNLEE
jgi:hypothetical protein